MFKNNRSSSIDEISKFRRIKNKLQEHIILQFSEELSIFQIAEKELTTQVQVLESQKEKRTKIIEQKIIKILVMIITSTIALKIIGTLTLFTQ